MALSRSRVLAEAVAHWNRDFTGITELDLSHRLRTSPGLVLRELRRLETRGLGQCTQLNGGRKGVIFFPSPIVLRDEFQRRGRDYGRYRNLLHLGASQIGLRYFELGVLKKYFDQQEKYRVDDSVMDGEIVTADDYYLSVREDRRQTEANVYVRYGKRTLSGGEKAVVAILKDLAALPPREQKHWESSELDSPQFASSDPDFDKFYEQEFEVEFVEPDDPLEGIRGLVTAINSLSPPDKMFTNDGHNPHLKYPVLNNRQSYCTAHNELWKLIGPDSLNESLIKRLLDGRNEPSSVDPRDGPLSKFKRLLASFDRSVADDLLPAFGACRTARIEHAHKVKPSELPAEDYLKRFRQECLALVHELAWIRGLLAGESV